MSEPVQSVLFEPGGLEPNLSDLLLMVPVKTGSYRFLTNGFKASLYYRVSNPHLQTVFVHNRS